MKKYKIASIINSMKLEVGGPSHSLKDLAYSNYLNNIQHDVVHLEKKINFNHNKKINYINLNQKFLRYGFSFKLLIWLIKNRNNYKLFIIHGIWQFQTLCARLIIPNKYIVFTHGMLDPYFGTELFKSIKKKIYWFFIEKKNLLKAKYVIANSEKEVLHLKNTFVDTKELNIKKVNYGIIPKKINLKKSKIAFLKKFNFLKKKKTIIYIGRIHPKKGCDLLVQAFKDLKKKHNYKLLIAGEINNNYARQLVKFVEKNNLKNKVYFLGFLKDHLKWGAISFSKCSILPSHGENFGVSVIESLSVKTPVICSNKVGVYNKIKKFNSGIIINDNKKSIQEGLEKFINLDLKKLKKLKQNCKICFNVNFNLLKNNYFSNWIKFIYKN